MLLLAVATDRRIGKVSVEPNVVFCCCSPSRWFHRWLYMLQHTSALHCCKLWLPELLRSFCYLRPGRPSRPDQLNHSPLTFLVNMVHLSSIELLFYTCFFLFFTLFYYWLLCLKKIQEISSYRNTLTSPSGSNNHAMVKITEIGDKFVNFHHFF